MKKQIRKLAAAALVAFQVILTAAVALTPVSAEAGTGGRKRSYHAYLADALITLDGKVTEGEAWDNIPWSEDVVKYEDTGKQYQTYYASFKSMWYQDAENSYLYFLINFNDVKHNEYKTENVHINLGVDETGVASGSFTPERWNTGDVVATEDRDTTNAFLAEKSGVIQISNAPKDGSNLNSAYRFCIQRKSNDDAQVMVEVEYTFRKSENAVAGKKLGFELSTWHGYWAKSGWNMSAWRGDAKDFGALYLEGASASGRKAITVADKNMIVVSADVTEGESYTLPLTDPHSTAQLVGWKDAAGNLYKPGAVISDLSANQTFKAVTVDFKTLSGAQVRFRDPTGLRFLSQVKKADYDALGEAATATGTLILPTDLLEGDLTLEAFAEKTEGRDYLNVTNSGWLNADTAGTDGFYQFSGAIVGIRTGNYARNFSAVGYLTVTYADGTTATFYGGYNAANATSIKTVAEKALADAEANPGKYTDAEKTILESYAK